MPIRAIFFDIDGTLVDSNDLHVSAWDEAFRDNGLRLERDEIRSQVGKGGDQLVPSLLPDIDAEKQHRIASRHGEIFRARYLPEVKPFPYARDLLELLHERGKQLLLASSADQAEVDHYVSLLRAQPILTGTVSKDDVANSKPAGDIFAAALARVFPIAFGEAIAVGDTPYDVEAAARSDVKTIALRSGEFSEEVLWRAGAAYVYASVKELFDNFDASPLNN